MVSRLRDAIGQKPLLAIDVAAAGAVYGIGDTVWQAGRYSAWVTAALNLPLRPKDSLSNSIDCYFSLLALARYLRDNYATDASGYMYRTSALDAGAKAQLELNRFSVGAEYVYRSYAAGISAQHRLVGMISYRIADNLYVNGSFGENFGYQDRLISLFHIRWGFGSESVRL